MNFFERQAHARKRTWLLLAWMLVAVVGIVLAMNAAAYGVALLSGVTVGPPSTAGASSPADGFQTWIDAPWWKMVTLATLALLLGGSVARYLTIAKGGRAIADMIDARRVDLASREQNDRRFINVVEEMSIASGTQRPALYVMEQEEAINAFVAGTRPRDAIMVVTRGALDKLSREELQGVVAHEYSHILNGDMRLNGRLMAIVAGILLFGKIGAFMLRGSGRGGLHGRHRHRHRGSGMRGDGRLMAAWLAAGVALLVIGYLGLFCGRMIKAAVSRQREFLADASSVQFTRNPDGISGALWRIQQESEGSLLTSAYAEDMSHMCFGQSIRMRLGGLLATHPPIDRRLAAIDPQFRARRVAERARARHAATGKPSSRAAAPGNDSKPGQHSTAAASAALAGAALADYSSAAAVTSKPPDHLAMPSDQVASRVGNPQPEHHDYARAMHEQLPRPVLQAAHEPDGAEALVYALFLLDVPPARLAVAKALLTHQTGAGTATRSAMLFTKLRVLGEAVRLPVLDLATPLLAEQPAERRRRVLDVSEKLSRIDRIESLFEFALLALLRHHLADENASDRPRFFRLTPVVGDLRRLLSLLARAGSDDENAASAAFRRAASGFAGGTLTLASATECDPLRMHDALGRMALLSPLLKQPVLEACADCIRHDGKVTVRESELLRAIAASLDCPLPPMVAGTASS